MVPWNLNCKAHPTTILKGRRTNIYFVVLFSLHINYVPNWGNGFFNAISFPLFFSKCWHGHWSANLACTLPFHHRLHSNFSLLVPELNTLYFHMDHFIHLFFYFLVKYTTPPAMLAIFGLHPCQKNSFDSPL